MTPDVELDVPAQALWSFWEHLEFAFVDPIQFDCGWACGLTLGASTLLLSSHYVVMAFPLRWWARGNICLVSYTAWTTLMYIITWFYVLGSPIYHRQDKWLKNIPLITGISITGIWAIMAVSELIKLLVHGKVFRSAAEIVAAYVVVLGIPHAAFTIYNLVRDIMWYYARNHGHYTAQTEEGGDEYFATGCEEDDWACWVRNGMDCTGPLCGDDGFIHNEYAGTEMEGPVDRRTHRRDTQTTMCWKDGVGEVYCGERQWKDGVGEVIVQPGKSFGDDSNTNANTYAENTGDKLKDDFYVWRDGVGWMTQQDIVDEEEAFKAADHVDDKSYIYVDGIGWEKVDPDTIDSSSYGPAMEDVMNPDGTFVDPALVNPDGTAKYKMIDQRQYNPKNPNYPYPPPPQENVDQTQMKLNLSMKDELDITEDTLPYTF